VQQDNAVVMFPFPIKIDRNTNIVVTNSTAVANVSASGLIFGYTEETVSS
jgi:hypothetical protein